MFRFILLAAFLERTSTDHEAGSESVKRDKLILSSFKIIFTTDFVLIFPLTSAQKTIRETTNDVCKVVFLVFELTVSRI